MKSLSEVAERGSRSAASLCPRLVVTVILAVAVLAVLAGFGDVPRLLAALQRFSWPLLVPVIGLTLVNYGIRFVKWELFLHRVGIHGISAGKSLGIFVAGFTMVMTPGKVGEFVKAYFVRQVQGASFARGAPVVLAERVTDGLAMVLLSLSGLAIGQAPILGSLAPRLAELYDSSRLVLAPPILGLSVGLGFVACYYLVLVGLGQDPGLPLLSQAVFILAVSTILGAVSLLPGGMGVTDGSLVGLSLWISGLDRPTAVAGALLIRLATLWFGIVALLVIRPWLGPSHATIGFTEGKP